MTPLNANLNLSILNERNQEVFCRNMNINANLSYFYILIVRKKIINLLTVLYKVFFFFFLFFRWVFFLLRIVYSWVSDHFLKIIFYYYHLKQLWPVKIGWSPEKNGTSCRNDKDGDYLTKRNIAAKIQCCCYWIH